MDGLDEGALNPAQDEVLALLGAAQDERPTFAAGLRDELRAQLEAGLAPLAEHLGERRMVVSKHGLGTVHACEAHHVASQGTFAWSVVTVRGSVAHKAVELAVNWRGTWTPVEAVDESIARLTESEYEPGPWLQARGRAELAELRGQAVSILSKFLECFPPLKAAWRPVTESRVAVDLVDDRVRLSGKVDLSLGQASGQRAGKVIIDLKTGNPSPVHRDDLRFYALLEAVRLGVPPRRVASYYLDSARVVVEDVTPGLLQAALRRTVDGAARMVALERLGHEPRRRASAVCGWCPIRADCEPGQAWLSDDDWG